MKRIITLALLLFIMGSATEAYSQGWLNRLGKKVEEKAKRKVEEKAEKAVDKAFDKAEDAVTGKGKKDKTQNNDAGQDADEQVAQDGGQQQKGQSLEMTYAKNDFVAGDEIIFEDLMDGEQLGEFPSMWDLSQGVAEVASVNGKKAIIFPEEWTVIVPLMKNMNSYLPDQYTIEMDLWLTKVIDNDKESKQYYRFDFYKNEDKYSDVMTLEISSTDPYSQSYIRWNYKSSSGQSIQGNGKIILSSGGWHHFSISFNKRAFKAYIDGVRITNIPNASQAGRFTVTRGWDYKSSAITNVRIAKGAVPLYDRMMSEGKFITYGITFDVGKSVIKPESMGEINRIVQLMTENPTLKFSVEGHTDSTGNATSNQTLSETRSKSIVDKLVEMGIAADRLTSSGKGQTTPIADNATDEGRAKNRRVEFVKI